MCVHMPDAAKETQEGRESWGRKGKEGWVPDRKSKD